MNVVKIKFLVFNILLIISYSANAQWTGSLSVSTSEIVEYSYTRNAPFSTVTWSVSNGLLLTSWLSPDRVTAYARVRWGTAGSGSLTVRNNGLTVSTRSVMITCTNLVPPTFTISLEGTPTNVSCVPASFRIAATVGAGGDYIKWYSSLDATTPFMEGNFSYNTPVLNSSTTYYISTVYSGGVVAVAPKSIDAGASASLLNASAATACESQRVAVQLKIIPPPVTPSYTGQEYIVCGSGSAQLFASAGTGNILHWYNDQSDTSPIFLGTPFNTPRISSNRTYYVSAYDPLTRCESSKVVVNAVVTPMPPAPSVISVSRCGEGVVSLSANPATEAFISWENSSGKVLSTGNNYNPSITNTTSFFVRNVISNNGECKSERSELVAIVHPIEASPIVSDVARCGPGEISLMATPGSDGNSVNWYATPESTVPLSMNSVYKIPYLENSASFYVSSKNLQTQCESNRIRVSASINTARETSGNYIIGTTLQIAGVMEDAQVISLSETKKTEDIQYFDGIGRNIQTVSVKQSYEGNDVVQLMFYDEAGRSHIQALPYTSTEKSGCYKEFKNPVDASYVESAHANFYNNLLDKVADDMAPYSRTVFEKSPLNRPLKHGAAGVVWQPDQNNTYSSTDHTLKYDYAFNDNEEVFLWTLSTTETSPSFRIVVTSHVATSSYYGAYTLYKRKIKDEHQREVIEYLDKAEKLVLKKVQVSDTEYADTYYIYNEEDQLVCVIPPEAGKRMLSSPSEYFDKSPADRDAFLKQWVYRYNYDGRNNLIEKQLPGADPVYLIYDNRDRLVLTQDGNQRNGKNEWTFTKYDGLNRPILTGVVEMGTKTVENLRDEVKDTDTYFETRGSAVHGYTNNAYPNVADESKYLTVTYYDDYDFLSSWTGYDYTDENLSATPHGVLYEQPDNHFSFVKGQVTGGKTKVLDGSNTWLKSVNYYDDKYRLVQTIADNHLDGIDKITNLYDFVGKVLKTRTRHNTQYVDRKFEYDHAGRLLETWHSINGADGILLAKNEYNELGQLVTKKLHGTSPPGAFKQSVDYRYNIRGWLEKINDVAAPEPDDFFSMELKYNNPSANGGTAQYNGNISEIVWKGAGMDQQSYGFYYDPMNRLTDANYFNATAPGTNGRFNEKIGTPNGAGPRYDLNGNILHLTRHGKKDGSPSPYGPMDELTYTYTGNQVTRIDDAIEKNVAEQGFKEEVKTDNEYTYDANGNMTKDANKGITAITYNHLNLPVKVSKSETEYIEYTYDATGRKLRQQVFGTTPKTTDYQGEFVYENNVLQFINHEEGRVVMTGSTPEYQYHLKDHLGNVRLTFTSKEEVEESIATMEDVNAAEEEVNYLYYNEAVKVDHPLFDRTDNHTPGGATHNATRLTGGNTNAIYGLARSLSVMPGDKINMEVWAKYLQLDSNPENWSASVRDFLTQYAQGSTTGVIDGGAAGSIGNTVFPYAGLLNRQEIDEQAPKAFITWLVFDRDYNPLIEESGYMQIGTEAKETGSNTSHQRLYRTAPLEIKQAGFVYIYLSNENETPVEVFFDDFKVEHVKSPVIQTQDYYPFGLTYNSYSRENSVENKFKFQGQEHIDDLNLGWDSFKWRNHQPDIARFFNIDPLADKYVYNSPYAFSENHVTTHVELEGLEKVSINYLTNGEFSKYENMSKPLLNDPKPQAPPTGGDKVLNGVGNVLFGMVGAIGSGIYVVGTEGSGAALGGGTAFSLSLGEVAIGFAQIVDGVSEMNGGNSDQTGILQNSSSLPGLVGNATGSENAPIIDAVGQFVPGMLTGGNLNALKEGWSVIRSSENAAQATQNVLSTVDAGLDTKGVIDAALEQKMKEETPKPNK